MRKENKRRSLTRNFKLCIQLNAKNTWAFSKRLLLVSGFALGSCTRATKCSMDACKGINKSKILFESMVGVCIGN